MGPREPAWSLPDAPLCQNVGAMDVVRWGLVGTARINRSVVPHMKAAPRHRLEAVASRDASRAAGYAREWEVPHAFGAYEAMLASGAVDAVYVSLPNALHAEWVVRAAEAGLHVLCEKPLALTLADVDRIAAAASRAGVVVTEAFMYRHHPQTARVLELVHHGALGRVRYVRGSFSYWQDRADDVRLDPGLGGGCLWDIGCYPVNFARAVMGSEPERVFGWRVLGRTGIDETFIGQLRFHGDAFAQFDASFRAPFRTRMEIVGDDGVLEVTEPFKPVSGTPLRLRLGDDIELVEVEPQPLYLGELDDLADAVLLGRPPRVSLADSRANVATLVALHQSATLGQPVPLDGHA